MSDNDITIKDNNVIVGLTNITFFPEIKESKLGIAKYDKLPIAEIASYGAAWQPVSQLANQILGNGSSNLYSAIIPSGQHLASLKDGSGKISTLLNGNNQIVGQARLLPVPVDPTMLIVAGVVANIEKKLDTIMEMQKDMMDFIAQKERSEIKGNLNFMMDVLKNYKYNIDNQIYKDNSYLKVLDVCQNAESKIIFYRERIINKTNKNNFIKTDGSIKKKVEMLVEDFEDYQMSLYLYSFSTYLGIILLGNYSSSYLKELANKIENYSIKYRDLYTNCYNEIHEHQSKTTGSLVRKGIGKLSGRTGEILEKVPFVKDTNIDEVFIGASKKLKKYNDSKSYSNLNKLVDYQRSSVKHFVDNINYINNICNGVLELCVDSDNIYIGVNETDNIKINL